MAIIEIDNTWSEVDFRGGTLISISNLGRETAWLLEGPVAPAADAIGHPVHPQGPGVKAYPTSLADPGNRLWIRASDRKTKYTTGVSGATGLPVVSD